MVTYCSTGNAHDHYSFRHREETSEGINLQDSFQAVVHYDLAWNPTRHEQREGRVVVAVDAGGLRARSRREEK